MYNSFKLKQYIIDNSKSDTEQTPIIHFH